MVEKQRKRRRTAPRPEGEPPVTKEDTDLADELATHAPLPPEPSDLGDESAESGDLAMSPDTEAVGRTEEETTPQEKPSPPGESAQMRTLDRKEVLARLLEKNEIILSLTKDNAEKEAQLKELNDRWIRAVAEFENYRKRTRKEWELLKQQAKSEVILDILNVVDDFERAFAVVEDGESSEFVQGIRLIYNSLTQTLERLGVHEVESLHEPFDPTRHMAVGQAESDDVRSGHVLEVIQKGYRLEETVIRPARVIVAK